MANWNGLVMTDKGIALQSKVQAGEVLNITKLKLGSGTLPAETDIRKLTDLIKPEQNLGIGGREANGDYCKISATISNVGLEAGYYVRELGVFAQDPDDGEILYAYTTDGAPDYLPAEGGSTVISQEFSVNIAVSDTDKINVEIDPGALATMGYIQLQVNEHNEDASAHEQAFSQHNIDETAHYDMTGATGSKAGKRGFVPAPKAGDQNKALFGNGQYQEVIVKTDIMVGATSSTAGKAGLVPAPSAGAQNKALFGDGTYKQVVETINGISAVNGNVDINRKFYRNIPDLGLSYATVTFKQIFDTMPNNSTLTSIVSSSSGSSAYTPNLNLPAGLAGTLFVTRGDNAAQAVIFTLISNNANSDTNYIYTCRYQPTTGSVSDWQEGLSIVKQVQDNTTGYIKYSDGRMEQWGTFDIDALSNNTFQNANVTFSQPFINTAYRMKLTLMSDGEGFANLGYAYNDGSKSTTGIRATVFANGASAAASKFSWEAKGWWK